MTELIIATSVVGVIMLGIVSSDFAIRRHTDAAVTNSQSLINAQGMIAHIMNTAIQANGNNTDRGIRIGLAGTGFANSMCIRTTTWVCYSMIANVLYTCNRASVGQCVNTDTNLGNLYNSGNTDMTNAASPVYADFQIVSTAGSQRLDLTVTLKVTDASFTTGYRALTQSTGLPMHAI